MPGIDRASFNTAVSFAGAATQSSTIDVRGYAGGVAHYPAAFVGGTVTWRVAPTIGAAYLPAYGYDKSLAQVTAVAGKAVEIHPAVMASGFAKAVRAVASAGAGAQTVKVTLKG